jgi:hypothetical protein
METFLNGVQVALIAGALATMICIVRQAFPNLNAEDQEALRRFWTMDMPGRRRDRALDNAWNVHVQNYPRSRKRILFAAFWIAALLSVMAHPLWL